MKVFIIASYKHAELYKALKEELMTSGYSLSHDWLEASNGVKCPLADRQQQELLDKDIQGIKDADFVLLILPAGNDSFVEYGAALAFGKPVYVLFSPGTIDYRCKSYDPSDCSHFNHGTTSIIPMSMDLGDHRATVQTARNIVLMTENTMHMKKELLLDEK